MLQAVKSINRSGKSLRNIQKPKEEGQEPVDYQTMMSENKTRQCGRDGLMENRGDLMKMRDKQTRIHH
jgi:hypothetical protein